MTSDAAETLKDWCDRHGRGGIAGVVGLDNAIREVLAEIERLRTFENQNLRLRDRIAAAHLSLMRRWLHFPVKQSTQAALHVTAPMAAAVLALRSQDVRPIISLAG